MAAWTRHLSAGKIACVLTFHSPDGSELLILSDTIKAIRPVDHHQAHIAPGIRSILYLGVTPKGFGVTETTPQVLQMIRNCDGQ